LHGRVTVRPLHWADRRSARAGQGQPPARRLFDDAASRCLRPEV